MGLSEFTRRDLLGIGLAVGAGLALAPRGAAASPDSAGKLIAGLTGNKEAKPGRIRIDMPQIAENGNAVPVTVTVDSPMTAADHVKAIHVVADGNPDPGVLSARLSPMSGKAEVSTRMRLAQTQRVWAIAEMSDGTVYKESTEVKVTIGGCGG